MSEGEERVDAVGLRETGKPGGKIDDGKRAAAGGRRALRSVGRPLSATITPPATSNAPSATNHLGRNKPDPSFMERRP